MASDPKPVLRRDPMAIEPEDIFRPSNEADILRQMAENRARWIDSDHGRALQIHAAIERERLDPEGVDRERRADRREAQQLGERAQR